LTGENKIDELIGELIGNYEVKGLLGEGGMGQVYLAENPRIGRKVAIKVLSQHVAADTSFLDRFQAEARAVTRIDHPNVIDIYDFGSLEDGRLYYVMELLRGQELKAVLSARGAMTAAETLPYVAQICAALQAAHDQGVVHRDLKPENIFVTGQDPLRIKVLDFGIAKMLEADEDSMATNTGVIMGTPRYISPEQAAGKPDLISTRTDLYSLGVIIYQFLCGEVPFQEEMPVLILAHHLKDPPPPLRDNNPDVTPAVAAIVHKCLEKAPEDRPASARELAEAFAMAADGNLKALSTARSVASSSISWAGEPDGAMDDTVATGPTAMDASALDATAPSLPPVDSAVRGTLTSTAGEMTPEGPAPSRSSRLPLLAGAAAILLLGGVLMFVLSTGESDQPTPAPATAAAPAPERVVEDVQPAADFQPRRRTDLGPPPPDQAVPDLAPKPDKHRAAPKKRSTPKPKKKPRKGPKKIGEGTLKIEL